MFFVIFVVLPFAIFLGIFVPLFIYNKKYQKYVLTNSKAIKKLKEINRFYSFKKIQDLDMEHSYDNENFYDDISCIDYLTYELVYIQKKVDKALKDTSSNKNEFEKYCQEINDKCLFDDFGDAKLLKNHDKLLSMEKKEFKKIMQAPQTEFSLKVTLILTNINGNYKASKYNEFTPKEIKDVEFRMNQKNGNFYLDNDIWNSICRVERGRVTNKMRFAIYERDHYRCRKCGRKTNDLEIDHIYPIAKGGKSTYDNLQTLCHRCNVEKGDKVEF